MVSLIQNILLALMWVALMGSYGLADFIVGFLIGAVLLWIGRRATGRTHYFERDKSLPPFRRMFKKAIGWVRFLGIYSWEVVKANVDVLKLVLKPGYHFRPAILAVPLDVDNDVEITLFANMITMTPGTLSLDVSDDKRTLYVHCMHIEDPQQTKDSLKRDLEALVHEVSS